jgi:hypothetical protein
MPARQLIQVYTDYQPDRMTDGEHFAFKHLVGGWITQEDVEGTASAALQHVISTLRAGDKLKITYEVERETD